MEGSPELKRSRLPGHPSTIAAFARLDSVVCLREGDVSGSILSVSD